VNRILSDEVAMLESSETRGHITWLTGLSGAGKTSLALALRARLAAAGGRVEVLDGDDLRTTLCKGLGFSKEDRDANVLRIGYVARLLARNGVATIVSAISPYRDTRDAVRSAANVERIPFVEVFVDAPIGVLICRDVKGLYRRALAGELPHFTGVSDPYEPPILPDVHLRTDIEPIETSLHRILDALDRQGLLVGRCRSVVQTTTG
jgi:adenylylsulfate kinase